jgi:predicted pyridoxine 5'-phosphate oxidase superfamily flavin-nucleotide-binding protein
MNFTEFSIDARRRTRRAFAIVGAVLHKSKIAMPRNREDLIRKLVQIQEQARITMEELPPTQKLARDRLKLIVGLAGYVATAIQIDEQQQPEVAPLPAEAPRKTLQ